MILTTQISREVAVSNVNSQSKTQTPVYEERWHLKVQIYTLKTKLISESQFQSTLRKMQLSSFNVNSEQAVAKFGLGVVPMVPLYIDKYQTFSSRDYLKSKYF